MATIGKKNKQSAESLQTDLADALVTSGYTPDFNETAFDFARPDFQSPDGKLYVSVTSTLKNNRIQDLMELSPVEVEQRFVFLGSEQLVDGTKKVRADGKILNLLNQSVQRSFSVLKPERVICIYKDAAYAPTPYTVNDRSLLEPRFVWSAVTDALSVKVVQDYLTNSKRIAAKAAAKP